VKATEKNGEDECKGQPKNVAPPPKNHKDHDRINARYG